MTAVYVPTLIESAEQAEQLPEDTVVIHDDWLPVQKTAGEWPGNSIMLSPDDLIGRTALVPVEADEYWRVEGEDDKGWYALDIGYDPLGAPRDTAERAARKHGGTSVRRYVTEWEAVS